MSKLKLRLIGLVFVLLSLSVLGGRAVANDCLDVITYAGPPDHSACYEFRGMGHLARRLPLLVFAYPDCKNL
jgi:hypothetical protein